MNRFVKNLIVGVASAAIIFSTASFSFADKPFLIHEENTLAHISSGVTHERMLRFTSAGWHNINVLRVDLTDEYTEIGTLFSADGISRSERLTSMMSRTGAVAGINGDFFSNNHSSYPLGPVVTDGKIVSTPAHSSNAVLPAFSIDNDNNPFIGFWTWQIRVGVEGKTALSVYAVNKTTRAQEDVFIYTRDWGPQSLGNRNFTDLIEIVVVDNMVTQIRIGQDPIAIPQNGYIIAGRGTARDRLLSNFAVGDKVSLDVKTSADFENIKAAVGGGSLLVKDGKRADFSINITGDQPRTALGISKDNKELIMVTIDGRGVSYKGMTQTAMAELMISLGAYNAINFDGGGSTTMAVAPAGSTTPTIVNSPSDGGERRVINGLGIFSSAPEAPLSYIRVSTDDTKMFVNTRRTLTVKGYDRFHNPVKVDMNNVTFSVSGVQGTFNKNSFTATTSGQATVKATYLGQSHDVKINVIGEVRDIELNTDIIALDVSSQRQLNNLYGKNRDGFTAKIYPSDVNWEVVGDIGHVKDGIFYSGSKSASGAIVARIGTAVDNILVSVGYEGKNIESFDTLNRVSFSSHPSTVTGGLSLSTERKEGTHSVRLNYDFTKSEDTRAAYIALNGKGITLEGRPARVGMWVFGDENHSWLRGTIVDNNKKSYNIDFASQIDWKGWKWVTAPIPSGVAYPVTLERVYVVETNPLRKHQGEILIDGLQALYPAAATTLTLPTPSTIRDERQKKVELTSNGYRFTVAHGIQNLDNLLQYHISDKLVNNASKTDIGIFMGRMNSRYLNTLTNTSMQVHNGSDFKVTKHKDIAFIQANNREGGIRPTNPNQWTWLLGSLSRAEEKNIVLMLPKPIFGSDGFVDKMEADLLHKTLSEHSSKDKNIWVIYGGKETKSDLRDGVRYIEIGNTQLSKTEDIFKIKYVEFTVNDGEMTYEILPLYTK